MALNYFNSYEVYPMIRPQLLTFLTVCRTGSFSKAASSLYLTPSAVLQQIRAMEKDFGTPLFYRNSTGVSLTPAGAYLQRSAQALVSQSEEIRREMLHLASAENRICIASSLMEKVRLLCDLWVLFSQEARDCEIQMLSIPPSREIPMEADLIESVNSGIDWMRQWEFLEICKVPMAFAVPHSHPLSSKEKITLSDLRSERVITHNAGSCDAIADLLELLRKNHIHVVHDEMPSLGVLWQTAFQQDVLIVPQCWSDILINMTVIPFEQDFLLPYGIFYRANPHLSVQKFLEFVRLTYSAGNSQGIVPVLN